MPAVPTAINRKVQHFVDPAVHLLYGRIQRLV
jgi:hypothetical protein